MQIIAEDKRVVIVSITAIEMLSLLGAKARQTGIIDFDPDKVDVRISETSGMSFDIIFEKAT